LDEKIEADRSTSKMDQEQLNKRRNPTLASRGKEGKTGWQSLEKEGQVDLGF
jgi:hypothetical protein